MSRDNILNIKAGRDVSIDALAVGDNARAVSIQSAAAEALASHFAEIRTVFDELESAGQITPVAARLLREETADLQKTAEASLTDEAEKETLALKLKRLGATTQSFCTSNEKVFKCLESIAACCSIPLAILGFGG
jgi:hypothetical protein